MRLSELADYLDKLDALTSRNAMVDVLGKPTRVDSVYQPDVWVEPRYVTEILADEITRSPSHTAGRDAGRTGYALRFPRIVTPFRADRAPEDATSMEEIKHLYELQRRG